MSATPAWEQCPCQHEPTETACSNDTNQQHDKQCPCQLEPTETTCSNNDARKQQQQPHQLSLLQPWPTTVAKQYSGYKRSGDGLPLLAFFFHSKPTSYSYYAIYNKYRRRVNKQHEVSSSLSLSVTILNWYLLSGFQHQHQHQEEGEGDLNHNPWLAFYLSSIE